METINAYGYVLTAPNQPLEKKEYTISEVPPDQVIVQVAGCGLCHTDISFYLGHVKTKKQPLVLGHEISGTVVATGDAFQHLQGKNVVIPAVLPCGECDLCMQGRDNICQAQQMPGNDFDGGFASHIVVPAKQLCILPENLSGHDLWQLSVTADAITTPYQSLMRSKAKSGEVAIVIGVGGIGIYMVQHLKNIGAHVIAIDIDAKKLNSATQMGAAHTINSKALDDRELKKQVRTLVKENCYPSSGWRVFETSGTAAGQNVAFSLLSFAGTVGIVGFTMDKLNLRLSNVMAFDADIFGNWGCSPRHYQTVVKDILAAKINVKDNTEQHPLDDINQVLPRVMNHQVDKRVVFVP